MKWLVHIGTDGVITLSARGKTNNQTSFFYLLSGTQTGTEKWTAEGVTVWRNKNFVEVLVDIREESDGDYVLATLPANLRPPYDVTAVIPENSTGVKGIISEFEVANIQLYVYANYTSLPNLTGLTGRAKWRCNMTVSKALEYDLSITLLDSEKVPLTAANAEGGQWDVSNNASLTPYPFAAGRSTLPSTFLSSYDIGYSNYSEPGTYSIYAHVEGGGYEADIPLEIEIANFFIKTLTISYYSNTNGYDVSEGDDASFSFFLETNTAVPADCNLYIFDGENVIYHEQEAVGEGETQTASLTTIWGEDFESEPWTVADVGNKALTFALEYQSGNKTITVRKTATVKITNGGA